MWIKRKKSNLESAWDFNRKKELNIAGCRFWTNKRTPANLFVHQGWSKEREHIKKTYTEIHTCSNSCNIKTWWTGIHLKSRFLFFKEKIQRFRGFQERLCRWYFNFFFGTHHNEDTYTMKIHISRCRMCYIFIIGGIITFLLGLHRVHNTNK